MVVNEKGLLRAMKDAYKRTGYTVAAENKAAIENIIIATHKWAVTVEKKNLPRKVLGLIAEHLGDIPAAGEAYEVKAKAPQIEIYDVAAQTIRNLHPEDQPLKIVKRTQLSMGAHQLWQRKEDLRMFKLHPDMESIVMTTRGNVRIIGDETLMVDDLESRAYIRVEKLQPAEEPLFDHLSKIAWVAM